MTQLLFLLLGLLSTLHVVTAVPAGPRALKACQATSGGWFPGGEPEHTLEDLERERKRFMKGEWSEDYKKSVQDCWAKNLRDLDDRETLLECVKDRQRFYSGAPTVTREMLDELQQDVDRAYADCRAEGKSKSSCEEEATIEVKVAESAEDLGRARKTILKPEKGALFDGSPKPELQPNTFNLHYSAPASGLSQLKDAVTRNGAIGAIGAGVGLGTKMGSGLMPALGGLYRKVVDMPAFY